MAKNADQNGFLGCLLGMGMGDALGMPVAGWRAATIRERYGVIDGYRALVFPDGAQIEAGAFTEESEIALCLVETATAGNGELDPDLIGPRLLFLARGEAKRWIQADTLRALEAAEETLHFVRPLDEDGPATGDVAVRGVPVGLLAAVGRFDAARLRADAETVVRLTHGSPRAIAAATALAYGVMLAARREVPRSEWAAQAAEFVGPCAVGDALEIVAREGLDGAAAVARLGDGAEAEIVVATGFAAAMAAGQFEDAVFAAVNAGGATDGRGAVAGALAGAWFGASGIPQGMIDELEGRIYLSLAAPWFHKAALKRAGLTIDLRRE
jgi:ADP-ribosyl-[dinitrogen reductase] hydrolase